MQKLNIDDVARLAFVSRSVVSRVLNKRSNVSDSARMRVMEVIQKYNYRPSSVARSLATHRTYEVSVLVPRLDDEILANGFWSLLILSISEACIQRGYFVSLNMISREAEAKINDRILKGHNLDGYILIGADVANQTSQVLREMVMPCVVIGNSPGQTDLSSVDIDNVHGGYTATKHLVELGHRRIAAINGPMTSQEAVDRHKGYLRAHEEAGLDVYENLTLEATYSHRGGYNCMKRLVDERPTAVFCSSDAQAGGALLAIHEAGLAVPNDLSVIGYDDLPAARYTIPPLTTMRQPIYKLGERAADIVLDQIEGKHIEPVRFHLQADLVERATCKQVN